jgi:hypothetical protein
MTYTFRSANGGVAKLVLLDVSFSGDTKSVVVPNSVGTTPQKLLAYFLSADSVMLAADDSYLVAGLYESRGQNEKIWRKINRP